MSNAHRHRTPDARDARLPGPYVAAAAALVLAAALLVPWAAGRLTRWPPAPAVAGFVALAPALYHWFRGVQRAKPRTAATLAVAYAAFGAGVLWLLTAT